MTPFIYERGPNVDAAIAQGNQVGAKYLGGGTNLVDLMRETIEHPAILIDVSGLSQDIEEMDNGDLRIGAGAKNSSVAADQRVRRRYPLLAQAILSGASAQIRNMASIGGNILQRTRCAYFYDDAARCNKRIPNAGCDAIDGFNRYHAILGASSDCVATHPSDMCVALAALDATVTVQSAHGSRDIPFCDFHRLPGDTPRVETVLAAGDMITAVTLPASSANLRSIYRKVRDRASYAFALVSVAGCLNVQNGSIADIRLALGGVAHKPWRAFIAEKALTGSSPTTEAFQCAAEAELSAAQGLQHNTFKIELSRRLIVDTLAKLADVKEART